MSNYALDSCVISNCTGYGLSFTYWCGTSIVGDSILNNGTGGIYLSGSCPIGQTIQIKSNYFNLNSGNGAIWMGGLNRRVNITENQFINNSGQNSGIISFSNGMSGDTIECNTFLNNSPSGSNQAVITTNPYSSQGLIKNNLFDGNIGTNTAFITAVWSGYVPNGVFTFENNIIRNNSGYYGCYFSPLIDGSSMLNVVHNEFYNNTATGVIFIDGYQTNNSNLTFLNLTHNSFIDSIMQIKLYNRVPYGSPNIYADSNYWGSTNTQYLDSIIYDYFDDANQSVVYYNPVLSSPLQIDTSCSFLQTGINNIEQTHFTSSIYPNPANKYFTIAFDNTINKGFVEVYNILGERILRENIYHAYKKEINVQGISNGIYLVKLDDGEKHYCKKIIVEHD